MTLKSIAQVYLVLHVFVIIFTPFLFGESRKPYSVSQWFWGIVANSPLLYLLFVISIT